MITQPGLKGDEVFTVLYCISFLSQLKKREKKRDY